MDSPGIAVSEASTSLLLLMLMPCTRPRPPRPPIRPLLRPKQLFDAGVESRPPPWTTDEIQALVAFLLLYTEGDTWQSRASKTDKFWDEAGIYIQRQVGSSYCRTGAACKWRVFKKLRQDFSSPTEAERHLNDKVEDTHHEQPPTTSSQHATSPPRSPLQAKGLCEAVLLHLEAKEQLQVMSQLLSSVLTRHFGVSSMPNDFLYLVTCGVQYLHQQKRSNIIYFLAKALGTMRPDGTDTLLPVRRMPMGLVEYVIMFFTASSIQKISCPPDYRAWLQTIYVLFGSKWAKIFSGPMWSYEAIMQTSLSTTATLKPVNALVSVPALPERTLRRDIEKSSFSTGPEIQTLILQSALNSNPGAWWWIKGDGVDVVKGLWESTLDEWSGDADLNDGKLADLYACYKQCLSTATNLGQDERNTPQCLEADLTTVMDVLKDDLTFLHAILQKTNTTYEEKLKSGKASEKNMLTLLWDLEELRKLNDTGCTLLSDIARTVDLVMCPRESQNLPQKLANIRSSLRVFTKILFHFKRVPASHIFCLMISTELRNSKPYALPVQCLPYANLTEKNMRQIINNLIQKMIEMGMNVAGFVSNGEFNYLRTRGYTRPLSVLQIRTDVRNKYARARHDDLLSMLTPQELPDGSVIAKTANPAIPSTILKEVLTLQKQGILMSDIIDRLRSRTVPKGYVPHTWNPGKTESQVDKLKSIVAQMDFQYVLEEWERRGVQFRTYMYVPEVHPITNDTFCEREDEADVLKRLASHTHSGGPDQLCLERFTEALAVPDTGLTYPALIGARKQSVVDAERFFGPELAEFMTHEGYDYEAKFVETIGNWRKACEYHGLSELQRCQYNYKFLNLILDELMPWHTELYDFSTLEVNRPIYKVLGFSKESLVAVIANIEGREWRRRHISERGGMAEHPRASTTDDVECFFSMARDTFGQNFTTKEFKYGFRKLCTEYEKRLDTELPFYYHTSSHTQYSEGPLPEFSQVQRRQKRKHRRAPLREQPAAFASRRATLPIHGNLGVCAQFHNRPLQLPPPPTVGINIAEHSYT